MTVASTDVSGYLSKWTNVIKGYQKRWFLLQGPLLSYYRNPEAVGRRCRGTFDLREATIDSESSRDYFRIIESSGRKHHLKALSADDKIKWVKALLDAINAARNIEGESDSLSEDSFVVSGPQSRSTYVTNRRGVFQNRRVNRSKLDPNLSQEVNRSRKADKITQSNSISTFHVEAVDSPSVTSVGGQSYSKVDSRNSKDFPRECDFSHLIDRLRRSSVTKEVAALCELMSSVDMFRTRLKQHTDALCSNLSGIESMLLIPDSAVVSMNHRSGNPSGLCPFCKQPPYPSEVDGTVQRLRLALTDHRVYVKEFQDTCLDALQFLVANVERWHRRILTDQERCVGLERTVEQLARQHRALELQLSHCYAPLNEGTSSENLRDVGTLRRNSEVFGRKLSANEEEQFFDANSTFDFQSPSSFPDQYQLTLTQHLARQSTINEAPEGSLHSLRTVDESSSESLSEDEVSDYPFPAQRASPTLDKAPELSSASICDTHIPVAARTRRTTISPSPKIALNLWSILKSAIGKDLTKLPLPVNFNEPISFLQRASEDLTYSNLLDKASSCDDPADQMAWVAAFSVSCYASTAIRTGKPFNPLLGETYELDRTKDAYGWQLVAEQVSHHPPGSALYCESIKHGWKLWFEFVLVSKFRGKYMSVYPKGVVNLLLPDGSRYTWTKATTIVHNLIVGSLWIDNCGDVIIRNHTNGYQCPMRFVAHSYFSRGPQKLVTGSVQTSSGLPVRLVEGCWDSHITSQSVSPDGTPLAEPVLLWKAVPLSPGADKIYNFSQFTVELNEPEPGVAPTDSRLRPDQRLMEEGAWDAANEEKRRLEQKQRAKRHAWEEQQAAGIQPLEPLYTPLWFAPLLDPVTGESSHVYLGKYWQAKASQDWLRCPDIF